MSYSAPTPTFHNQLQHPQSLLSSGILGAISFGFQGTAVWWSQVCHRLVRMGVCHTQAVRAQNLVEVGCGMAKVLVCVCVCVC